MLSDCKKIENQNLIASIASNEHLDRAYLELRAARIKRDHRDLFWSLPPWEELRFALRLKLQSGTYCFSAVNQIQGKDGSCYSEWEPEDLIVLKSLSYVLTPLFCHNMDLSAATHLKDHGGLKGAVRQAKSFSSQYKRVIKTDIADYYESMDHHLLHEMLCESIHDPRVQRLLWQVMDRVHVTHGVYRAIKHKGIPRGCPLSPLFAAIYLQAIDQWAKDHGVAYVRYMDDFVIFCDGRQKIRTLIKELYQQLKLLGLKLSIPKTWIGSVKKGFSFLGYEISPKEIKLSQISWQRMRERLSQRYAQGATPSQLLTYLKRWLSWAKGGVSLNVEKLLLTTSSILPNNQLRRQFINSCWS